MNLSHHPSFQWPAISVHYHLLSRIACQWLPSVLNNHRDSGSSGWGQSWVKTRKNHLPDVLIASGFARCNLFDLSLHKRMDASVQTSDQTLSNTCMCMCPCAHKIMYSKKSELWVFWANRAHWAPWAYWAHWALLELWEGHICNYVKAAFGIMWRPILKHLKATFGVILRPHL